jgi:hypothetical protein
VFHTIPILETLYPMKNTQREAEKYYCPASVSALGTRIATLTVTVGQ